MAGIPVKEIAATHNLTRARVYEIIKHQCNADGSATRQMTQVRTEKRKIRKSMLVAYIRQNRFCKVPEVARQYKLSPGRVYRIVRDEGCDIRK